ncbi:hypothetical protein FS842_002403 [Serendipita sp. 407]|nr:hypothetical protein FS842_002403 [Serendipita sp. 407]
MGIGQHALPETFDTFYVLKYVTQFSKPSSLSFNLSFEVQRVENSLSLFKCRKGDVMAHDWSKGASQRSPHKIDILYVSDEELKRDSYLESLFIILGVLSRLLYSCMTPIEAALYEILPSKDSKRKKENFQISREAEILATEI